MRPAVEAPRSKEASLVVVVASLSLAAATLSLGGCASTAAAGPEPRDQGADPSPTPSVPEEPPLPDAPAAIAAKPVPVATDVEEDPALIALLAPYSEEVTARASRVVGVLGTPLDKAPRGVPESTLGNWVSDAMRAQAAEKIGRPLDVCFTNNGGLRRSLPAGDVTEGMVVELMPFDNAIVVMDVSGERAAAIIAHVAETGDPASGLTYVKTASAPGEVRIGGAPLDRGRTYAICTTDYLFEGGGGYELQDVTSVTYTGVLLRDLLLEELEEAHRAGKSVQGSLDGRARSAGASASGAAQGEGT